MIHEKNLTKLFPLTFLCKVNISGNAPLHYSRVLNTVFKYQNVIISKSFANQGFDNQLAALHQSEKTSHQICRHKPSGSQTLT